MIDRALLQRIRKCLALSASSNEHEAAAALAKARELMRDHGVSDADLALADIEEKAAKGSRNQRPSDWEHNLVCAVERALSVKAVLDFQCEWLFVGRGPTAEIAAYAFEALFRRLKAARAEYLRTALRRCSLARKRVRGDAYCEGWSSAVYAKIIRLAPHAPDEAALDQYIARRFGRLTAVDGRAAGGKRTAADYFSGARAGRTVDLHHGMTGCGANSLIGGAV